MNDLKKYETLNSKKKDLDPSLILMEFDDFLTTFSCKPDNEKFPHYAEHAAIDENKSLKWNREEVVRRNTARDEEVKRLNRLKSETYGRFEDALFLAISNNFDISVGEASKLWHGYFYPSFHHNGIYSIYNEMVSFLDIYDDVLEARKVAAKEKRKAKEKE